MNLVTAPSKSSQVAGIIRQQILSGELAPNTKLQSVRSLADEFSVGRQVILSALGILEQEKDVRVNLTMVFSSTQAFLAMKAGASFVSIVLSRLDNIANESYILAEDAVAIKQNYGYSAEVLAGSLKTQNHMLDCLRAGVDIVTVPELLFFQMFKHPLTDQGLAEFDEAWKTVKQ